MFGTVRKWGVGWSMFRSRWRPGSKTRTDRRDGPTLWTRPSVSPKVSGLREYLPYDPYHHKRSLRKRLRHHPHFLHHRRRRISWGYGLRAPNQTTSPYVTGKDGRGRSARVLERKMRGFLRPLSREGYFCPWKWIRQRRRTLREEVGEGTG